MMKLLATLLSLALLLSLTACTTPEKPETAPPSTSAALTTAPPTEAATETIAETTTEPTTELEARTPMFDHIRFNEENEYETIDPSEDGLFLESLFEGYTTSMLNSYGFMIRQLQEEEYDYYLYTPYVDGMRATICDPYIMHDATSLILLTVPDGINVPELSEQILHNVDERRLICCIYESISVAYAQNTILLAMCSEALARHVLKQFSDAMGSAETSLRYTEFNYEYKTYGKSGSLETIAIFQEAKFMEALHSSCRRISFEPNLVIYKCPTDRFEDFTTLPYSEGMEATVCVPASGNAPHQVVVLTVPKGSDVDSTCDYIRSHADPQQMIGDADGKVAVEAVGNTILFVMSEATITDTIVTQFHEQMK